MTTAERTAWIAATARRRVRHHHGGQPSVGRLKYPGGMLPRGARVRLARPLREAINIEHRVRDSHTIPLAPRLWDTYSDALVAGLRALADVGRPADFLAFGCVGSQQYQQRQQRDEQRQQRE